MSESESEVCQFCLAEWPVMYCLVRPGVGCRSASDSGSDTDTEEGVEALTEAYSADYPDNESDEDNGSDKGDRTYKDARSTGRKRAAKLYPIEVGQVCDWAWSKQCGGGVVPIVGCTGRPAEHIHHGPDKSTFNNEPTNISRVCTYCHNRWHAANDPFYVGVRPEQGQPYLPIVPDGKTIHSTEERVAATREEIFANELAFPVRGKDKVNER